MTERGFIALARGILEHPVIGARGKFSRYEAWTWLLFQAAWKPHRYAAGPVVVDLERGQLAHSTRYMAQAWGWAETNVRRFLSRLKTGAMIGAETGAGVTIITICNYESYQSPPLEIGAETGAPTGAKVAQKRTREQVEDIYPAKNPKQWPSDCFARWYATYPKKVEKIAARKSFDKVQASGDLTFDDLMAATAAYCEEMRTKERQYIKGPAVWLNKGCYFDERAPPKGAPILTITEPARDPLSFTESDWRDRLANNWAQGQWSGLWGPRPGEPGCHVPAHLLNGGAHV